MTTRTKRFGATIVTAAVAAVSGLVVATPAVANPNASKQPNTITWAPCEEDPTADCGTLAVPIDWARPHGPTIDLALARRKATDPAARIGSLVINPGGPGGSGVDFALFGQDYFAKEITRRFDLVGFDPRGVARSHPVICSAELMAAAPSPILKSQADFETLVSVNRKLAEDCRQRTGPLYDHVDTLSVVHDLDAIRAAVGDKKLTYYGVSYGTLIGQQYAEVYGDRIRAVVVDSNMDHSIGTTEFFRTETIATQDSFDEFAAWCERTKTCQLRERGVSAVYADLRARAERGELSLPGLPEFKLDAFFLAQIVTSGFYGPSWAELAELLALLESGAAGGPDPTATGLSAGAAALVARFRSRHGLTAGAVEETVENPMPVFCEDWSLPVRDYRQYAALVDQMWRIAKDFGPSPLALGTSMSCVGWPGKVNNPQRPLRAHNRTKLLMLNAVHDPATAYLWALNAARQLGDHAVFVTYEGWGHGVYGRGPCADTLIDAYLTSVALPDRGIRCPAVEPSDQLPESAAARGLVPSTGGSPIVPARPGQLPYLPSR